jgi:hypothetical protein
MRLIGAHICMAGIPLQTWLKLASGALQPPVLLVQDLPVNNTAHTFHLMPMSRDTEAAGRV